MYLFVFAFLGNLFYVASILSSPKMNLPASASNNFIRESIPSVLFCIPLPRRSVVLSRAPKNILYRYLLGSGGTLMFDITIVTQSLIYRPRPRRHSLSRSRLDEEETGLLSGEPVGRRTDSLPRGRTSRTRTGTV
jgi:hypothetical protein